MREILFKAKRIDNGEWVEGDLIQTNYLGKIRGWISAKNDATRLRVIATKYTDWRAVEVNTDTICQYTGLTDSTKWEELTKEEQSDFLSKWNSKEDRKNTVDDWKGRQIWENDIVKKHFYTDYDAYANSEEYTGKVEYLDCAWNIVYTQNAHKCVSPIFMAIEFKDAKHYEVIGNIFDNKELLEN